MYREGVQVRMARKPHPHRLKGEYDPSTMEVILYTCSMESGFDRDLTLLHELVHAHGKVKAARGLKRENEEFQVELEALRTYLRRPHVLIFAKELYNIK